MRKLTKELTLKTPNNNARLPRLPNIKEQQDIQFAPGFALLALGGDAVLSYGVADCHSAIARLPDFLDSLPAMLEHAPKPAAQVPQTNVTRVASAGTRARLNVAPTDALGVEMMTHVAER